MAWVEAVILAGGLGTRLLPLTESTPKSLVPVAGVPFVVHQLAKLAAADIRRVVLATSYQADRFEPVLGDGSAWDLDIRYVTEAAPLGTGGAIRNASRELRSGPRDRVVVLNSDILSGHDLQAQLSAHQHAAADVTLHLVESADPSAYGSVPTDSAGNVTAFVEKSPHPVSSSINAGCYVFARELIECIPEGEVVSVERETFPQLVAAGCRVVGYRAAAYWIDVGTPQALCRASADLVLGVASSAAYRKDPASFSAADSARIAPTATLTGGTSVGARVRVADRARLDGSLVRERALIGEAARVTNSAIGAGAVIGASAVVEDCAVGDGASIPPGTSLRSERVTQSRR